MNISQQSFFSSSSSSLSQTPNLTTQASLFSIKISIHKRTSVRLIIIRPIERRRSNSIKERRKKNEED